MSDFVDQVQPNFSGQIHRFIFSSQCLRGESSDPSPKMDLGWQMKAAGFGIQHMLNPIGQLLTNHRLLSINPLMASMSSMVISVWLRDLGIKQL